MRLGLALPQLGGHSNADQITHFARVSEELGYESLWVGDRVLAPVAPSDPFPAEVDPEHPYPPEFRSVLDPLVVLAAAAAATTTVRLGSSTLNAPLHNAVLLARTLTSLDRLCAGRLDVGFGFGWLRQEYIAAGVSWQHRGSRLEEILDVLNEMWTQNPAEYAGKHFQVPRAHVDLRPVQPGGPPVLLGGVSPAAMNRIGRRAAGWLPLYGMPADYTAQLWHTAQRAAEDAGRDPDLLRRELRINLQPGQDARHAADAVAQARDAGVDGAFLDFQFATSSVAESLSMASEVIARVGSLA
ncbi:MAG: TIGR03619 family F420-dependent LLM class oxidoreductase [Actinobacteria bacterium]|nr:TIGR03619 family F420-dependent LLM class oxidoreductase [Actinomycetota bacterium]